MRFESQVFWLSKDSAYPDEYQDAFRLDAERGIAAIADGVSSAIFSGPWARILTEAAVLEPPQPGDATAFDAWLARQRAAWTGQIDTSRLTWFQKPKMVDGAMATLLWIELTPLSDDKREPREGYRLRGHAIGDCCLFHIRDGELLRSFPMTAAAEFGLNPAVLGSVNRKFDHLLEFQVIDETCYPGDLLVLCSDAIALWAMNRYDAGESVDWEEYWNMPDEVWREEIFAHREANAMRFDDSTLLLLRPIPETAASPAADDGDRALSVISFSVSIDPTARDCEVAAPGNCSTDISFGEPELITPRTGVVSVPLSDDGQCLPEQNSAIATELEPEIPAGKEPEQHPPSENGSSTAAESRGTT
jgi:hypothetical protein